jgi:hypothetical protein
MPQFLHLNWMYCFSQIWHLSTSSYSLSSAPHFLHESILISYHHYVAAKLILGRINNLADLSSTKLSSIYQFMRQNNTMTQHKQNYWNYQVRAPFKKVLAWDVLFFVLGIGVGTGIGAFLAAN